MKKFGVFFLAVLLLLSFASCKKKTEVSPPVIEMFSPSENELYQLPAVVIVKFSVTSEEEITYIRISVENEHQVPIAKSKMLYPEPGESDFEVDLLVDQIPEDLVGPTYLHVKAENSNGIAHEFLSIRLENPELVSKGFYLITRPGIQQTKVQFYDSLFSAENFLLLSSEFNKAAFSIKDDMLYVSVKSPDKLEAYRHQNSELAWMQQAQMPFPEFFSLNLIGRIIYTGTGNGQIWGFRTDNGSEQFISPLVFDSVPGEIGVFEDYIVADYKSLISPDRGWIIFYKQTAAVFQKHSSQLSVSAFYPALSKNYAVVFGNIGSLGVIQFYDIENNKIKGSLNFATGIITASCQMEAGYFLIAVGKEIWRFNEQQQSVEFLQQSLENVVGLQYDMVSKYIYVATEQQLSVYNASGDTLVAGIESSDPIRAVCLRLGYPSLQDE